MAWLRCSRCSFQSSVPDSAALRDPDCARARWTQAEELWFVCPSCHQLVRARTPLFCRVRRAFAWAVRRTALPFDALEEPARGRPTAGDTQAVIYPAWMIDYGSAAMWWMR
jgi:hypothetical protein